MVATRVRTVRPTNHCLLLLICYLLEIMRAFQAGKPVPRVCFHSSLDARLVEILRSGFKKSAGGGPIADACADGGMGPKDSG